MIAVLPSSLLAALPLAVAAGFVSFISPCVLPLLPGYLAFLSGAAGTLEGRSGRGRAVVGALAFVIGFAIVFVSLGTLFGGFGALLKDHERMLSIVFGLVAVEMVEPRTTNPSPATRLDHRRGRVGIPVRARMDAVSRSNPGGDPRTGGREFERDRTTRIDPGVLLLLGTRHPVRRRRAGHRVGVDRVVVATSPPTHDRANRWRAVDRHRDPRGDGRVALVRPLVASELSVVARNFVVMVAS